MNRQYLLLVDEVTMNHFKNAFAGMGIQFLEVQGMGMSGGTGNILVTPIRPPVPQMEFPVPQLDPAPDAVNVNVNVKESEETVS